MTIQLPRAVSTYIEAINHHDPAAFIALFADSGVVDDVDREFRGRDAIKGWSDREIFDARVTLEVLDITVRGDATVVTTKVDGNFDRTGLPDPLVIEHSVTPAGDKIARLTCRLKAETTGQ